MEFLYLSTKKVYRFDGAVLMFCLHVVDVGILYITAQLETPREGYDEHNSKSFLSCETKVFRTSRRKNQTSEGWCPLALRHSGQWRQENCRHVGFHQQQRGTCTQYTQVLCPNSQWGYQCHRVISQFFSKFWNVK
jgi:hypothetical protein